MFDGFYYDKVAQFILDKGSSKFCNDIKKDELKHESEKDDYTKQITFKMNSFYPDAPVSDRFDLGE